ncbi:MAG: Flp pilus assembly protein CpaB [Sphingobium sp.]|nr:Flp pilus assembly protein CpaB [Sphingobium sp.]MBP6110894.1 Flp pilus assembly protein CpaB [Sphingobium sp.]MBP8672148.1 Flp pilus assembly protein CpaB [Sphingobium sp.]MBP9157034.1 Flp pilus assembly protein CpaB [Sphingobium sp.]MCC6482258.1 Flp pilus assembly protein CpaB [Sphingomonadaceae bacterium]
MDVKKAALLAGALIIAVAAALMARSMFSGGGTPNGPAAPQATAAAVPQQALDGPQVLVATRALPVGTIIDAESFRFQPWPKDLVEEAYFLQGKTDPQSLQGAVVRNTITAGQPVTHGALIRPGERGFLAAALGPGMRAVTVPVSMQSSVAGFIFPGDRVDVLVTQTVTGEDTNNPLRVTETIVRNLRVLATDQRTNALDEAGKPDVRTFSNVTLEVTPRIAEKIAVSQTIGQLSLTLRALADTKQDLDAAIASGTVALPNSNDPAAEKRALTTIASRPEDGRFSQTTGGDVSRYARRSMPPRKVVPQVGALVRVARGTSVEQVEIRGN